MLTELCNLGRDATLNYTPSNKAVCNLALAYSVGYGNNKKTQWLDASLWGDRAEKLSSHLTKGTKVMICADDVFVETFQKNDGTQGHKLKCRIVDIKFAGNAQQQEAPAVAQTMGQPLPQRTAGELGTGQPQQHQAPAQNAPAGFDDFSDDICF